MVTAVKLQHKLDQHFRYLGYKEGKNLSKLFMKWFHSNGTSWTVKRIKTLKTQFIHLCAYHYIDRDWISFKGKYPRGILGPLFRSGVESRKERKRVLAILNAYLVFIGKNTKKLKETLENIAKPITNDSLLQSNRLFVGDRQFFSKDLRRSLRKAVEKVAYYDTFHVKTNTGYHSGNPFGQTWIESLDATRDCILPTEILSSHFVKKRGVYHPPPVIGELVPLYERGDKVRVVAMPYAEIQLYMEPLHMALNDALKCVKEDCTFDQEKGAKYAHSILRSGNMVHSVDLSAATDRFPAEFQLRVLRNLFPDPDMINWGSIFTRIIQSKWKSPLGDITYGAGQPMGTYGSFALFALTHHALLHSLCIWHNIPKDEEGSYPYRILGDDIVIGNYQLYDLYRTKIDNLGVEISVSKSINSSYIAEFAGFIIDRYEYFKPVKPEKYRLTNEKIIQYIQTSNHNHFSGVNGEVGELLKFLPTPFGAGLNPMGQSREKRLYLYGYRYPDLERNLRESIPEEDIFSVLNSSLARNTSLSWISFTNTETVVSMLLKQQSESRPEILKTISHLEPAYLMNLGQHNLRKIASDGLKLGDLDKRNILLKGATCRDADMHQEDYVKYYKELYPLFPWKCQV